MPLVAAIDDCPSPPDPNNDEEGLDVAAAPKERPPPSVLGVIVAVDWPSPANPTVADPVLARPKGWASPKVG